ncbi:response regulator [Thermodesulfobacteriota bacterium]
MAKKILVVDNHPIILKYLRDILETEGHQVLTADDGLAALDILGDYAPDIIFVDLVMPNIGGKKLCQIIRKMPQFSETYIIILSAIAAEEEIDLAEFGADICVAKAPFNVMKGLVLGALNGAKSAKAEKGESTPLGVEKVHARAITRELLTVNHHYEIMLGRMKEGILETSPDGRIVYANPEAISQMGLPEEKLLGSKLGEHFHQEERGRLENLLGTMTEKSKSVTTDSVFALNGKKLTIAPTPLKKEGQGSIIILNDVSERKKIEEQLQQAQKMEAVGTLAGGIAHDFNNLLMAVQGNISLILFNMEPTNPDYERLKNIEKQVHKGARLTNQLLGYARKGRYEIIPISLNRLIEDTAETFARTTKEIEIHRDLAEGLMPIEADQGQIEQVLLNLYVNAADAMEGGGDLYLKTINISHEEMKDKLYEPKPGKYIQLIVTDTGIGMEKETMDRIFEPFFTTKDMGRGTGLGLASVYGIVKGHAGYIEVESKKEQGTTFRIYLPAAKAESTKNEVKPQRKMVQRKESILLVDDEDMIVDIGKELLSALGYSVFIAGDGNEAIEIYRRNQEEINLVLLDMVMPGLSGGETYNLLKEIDPDVKVLLSSGYSIDGEATKILDRGCNGFIQKPFSMKMLDQKIREILGEEDE